jgi:hypothetical protein
MYLRFTVGRPPSRAAASLTRLRESSRVELLGQHVARQGKDWIADSPLTVCADRA